MVKLKMGVEFVSQFIILFMDIALVSRNDLSRLGTFSPFLKKILFSSIWNLSLPLLKLKNQIVDKGYMVGMPENVLSQILLFWIILIELNMLMYI